MTWFPSNVNTSFVPMLARQSYSQLNVLIILILHLFPNIFHGFLIAVAYYNVNIITRLLT